MLALFLTNPPLLAPNSPFHIIYLSVHSFNSYSVLGMEPRAGDRRVEETNQIPIHTEPEMT